MGRYFVEFELGDSQHLYWLPLCVEAPDRGAVARSCARLREHLARHFEVRRVGVPRPLQRGLAPRLTDSYAARRLVGRLAVLHAGGTLDDRADLPALCFDRPLQVRSGAGPTPRPGSRRTMDLTPVPGETLGDPTDLLLAIIAA